jgi:hypothetical protein
MAIYAPLTLMINLRYLPAPFRPSRVRVVILLLVSAFYIAFGIIASVVVVRHILG